MLGHIDVLEGTAVFESLTAPMHFLHGFLLSEHAADIQAPVIQLAPQLPGLYSLHVRAEQLECIVQDLVLGVVSHFVGRQEGRVALDVLELLRLIALSFGLASAQPVPDHHVVDAIPVAYVH